MTHTRPDKHRELNYEQRRPLLTLKLADIFFQYTSKNFSMFQYQSDRNKYKFYFVFIQFLNSNYFLVAVDFAHNVK